MESLRRVYGIGEPVRRGMELRIAGMGEWRPRALGVSAGVHSDILSGRDAEVGWEDVFVGKLFLGGMGVMVMTMMLTCCDLGDELRDQPDFHSELESKMRMNW
jgi:proteasome maturation protein